MTLREKKPLTRKRNRKTKRISKQQVLSSNLEKHVCDGWCWKWCPIKGGWRDR